MERVLLRQASLSFRVQWSALTPTPSGPAPPHPVPTLQCAACCSELPPLPADTLAELQQEEAEMNANGDEEVRRPQLRRDSSPASPPGCMTAPWRLAS